MSWQYYQAGVSLYAQRVNFEINEDFDWPRRQILTGIKTGGVWYRPAHEVTLWPTDHTNLLRVAQTLFPNDFTMRLWQIATGLTAIV